MEFTFYVLLQGGGVASTLCPLLSTRPLDGVGSTENDFQPKITIRCTCRKWTFY